MPTDRGRPPPHRPPPRPDRIRRITGGFAFVPNELLHRGFFAQLSHTERSLYFFLVLAGDRNGVSFYSHDRICAALELTLDDYLVVRDRLIDMDLIAFRRQPVSGPVAAAGAHCAATAAAADRRIDRIHPIHGPDLG